MEIIITTLLFVTVSSAAYKIYVEATRSASQTRLESLEDRKLQQFFAAFKRQVENAIQLPLADRTAMQLTIPFSCRNIVEDIGWGFIPYPGVDLQEFITNHATIAPVEPMVMPVDEADNGTDALRMVTIPPDADSNLLVQGETTAQGSNSDTFDIEGTPNFEVGDFIVISDFEKRDLMRVTAINDNGDGTFAIEHDPSKSAWNVLFDNFDRDYGENLPGGVQVFKVDLLTYVVDTATQTLMVDNHTDDDGFDGTSFAGPLGPALSWQPVANGIAKMQIWYTAKEGVDGERTTRQPRPGEPGVKYEICESGQSLYENFCGCDNEVGNPGIKDIRVELIDQNGNDIAVRSFIPINLKRDLPGYSGEETVEDSFGFWDVWYPYNPTTGSDDGDDDGGSSSSSSSDSGDDSDPPPPTGSGASGN